MDMHSEAVFLSAKTRCAALLKRSPGSIALQAVMEQFVYIEKVEGCMYYSDLSSYAYKLSRPISAILNVGWVEKGQEFPKGNVSSDFLEKLKRLIIGSDIFDASFNRIRGVHPCALCGERPVIGDGEGREEMLGMSEVLVPGQGKNAYYASPSMIYHYVADHNYLPPAEYVNAVLAIDVKQPYRADDVFDSLLMNR